MLLLPAQALHYSMPIIARRATAAELPRSVVSLKSKPDIPPVIAAGARPRAVQGLERWVIYTAASALTSVNSRQLARRQGKNEGQSERCQFACPCGRRRAGSSSAPAAWIPRLI